MLRGGLELEKTGAFLFLPKTVHLVHHLLPEFPVPNTFSVFAVYEALLYMAAQ